MGVADTDHVVGTRVKRAETVKRGRNVPAKRILACIREVYFDIRVNTAIGVELIGLGELPGNSNVKPLVTVRRLAYSVVKIVARVVQGACSQPESTLVCIR